MPTLQQVKQQVQSIDGLSKFLGKREIKELPNILWNDENVQNIIQGTYNNGNGILVATNKRLIFVDKGMIFGLKVEDFPYNKISSIQYDTGLLLGTFTIFASGNKAVIKNVQKQNLRNFGEWVRNRINQSEVKSEPTDVADQIQKLAKLRDDGVLTEDEFQSQKRKVLGL